MFMTFVNSSLNLYSIFMQSLSSLLLAISQLSSLLACFLPGLCQVFQISQLSHHSIILKAFFIKLLELK